MKKLAVFFLLVCLGAASLRAEETSDPFQQTVQSALASNPNLFAKHGDVKAFLEKFVSFWKDLLQNLSTQPADSNNLEGYFAREHELLQKTQPAFARLKPPGDFKDFHEIFSKGLEALSDWCYGMQNRIHYAKTDYQKSAYMKRIEGFQREWFESFFGPALEELSSELSMYVTSHWVDNLDSSQQRGLKKKSEINRYLIDFHKITYNHLKSVASISKKSRSKENDDDPEQVVSNLKKELSSVQKTVTRLQKVSPPAAFKDFHSLELEWLATVARGLQKLMELEKASRSLESNERIQALINEKNQIDQQSSQLRAGMDRAYDQALKSLAQ